MDGADRALVFDAVRSFVEVSAAQAAANAGQAVQGAAITAQAVGEVVGEMIGEAVGNAIDRVQSGASPKNRRLP